VHLLADKYFVILGGSRDQKPSVINAKELGFKTIVFDKDSNACCKNISDYFFNISSRDWKSIKKKLLKFKDQTYGVIAQGSDIPVIVSKIEGFLNIKNRSPLRSSKICSDKRLMKNFFIKHNIPTPKIFTTKKKIEDKDFPVIIKPINLSGSKGVYICKNKKELKQNFDLTKKVSRGVICEKFYEGPQLSTETLIINSKIYTYGFAERNYNDTRLFYPNILENGGVQRSDNLSKFKYKIDKYIKKLSKLLNIKNGVIKGDIVIFKNRPYFIEIALRLSGGDFSETLIPKSTGINLIKCAIKNAAGLKIDSKELKEKPKYKQKYYANRYFFSNKDFTFKKIYVPRDLKRKKWLHKIEFTKNKKIKKTNSHSDRFGVFVVYASKIKTLKSRINLVYKNVRVFK